MFFLLSAQDSAGRSSVREQHFTLEDNLIPGFGLIQSFLLLTDHYILGRALFIFTIVMNVGGLMAFRFMRVSVSRGEPPLVPSHSCLDTVKSRCSVLHRTSCSCMLGAPAGQ